MFDSHHAICELIYVTLILFALHYIQQNARSTVQTEQAMPKEAWGRAADAAADMSESETYQWDSVCSAGVSFCFLKSMFWKDFLLEGFF